jgi:hypothetical protein
LTLKQTEVVELKQKTKTLESDLVNTKRTLDQCRQRCVNLSVEIHQEVHRLKLIDEKRQLETTYVEKFQYVKKCWEFLQKHTNSIDSCALVNFEVQHPTLTWDQIISKAHILYFNQIYQNYSQKENCSDDYVPYDQLIHNHDNYGKISIINPIECDCYERTGYKYCSCPIKQTIRYENLREIPKYKNILNFIIDYKSHYFGNLLF